MGRGSDVRRDVGCRRYVDGCTAYWYMLGIVLIHPCDPPVLSLRPFLRIVSVVQFRKRRELIDFFLLPPGLPPIPGAGGS